MKKDEFGPQYMRVLEEATATGTGVTTGEMARMVGSSRQRAYMWVTNNRAKLRVTGKTQEGANRYVLAPAGVETTDDPGTINTGSRLLVRNVKWQGGLVLELELDDGTLVTADIRQ